ncbi:MAG: DUF885 domain-containing protein [Actinomycetota bacterium]|nr:DUF885 domain-containing protein [Actinomycetota bacterium]
MDISERYVRLCLRVGRHVDGFIDAFFGPSEWEQSVAVDEPVDPRRLRDEAELLLEHLGDAHLEDDRRRWLRGQLGALECVTARLSGEGIAWADEVERCLGVRPARIDTRVFEAVHRRLDDALAGSGTVRERYVAWDERNAVPRDKLVPALDRLKEVLVPRAHALTPLPPEESVTYEIVSGKPWIAYAWYAGEHRTRVEVNADLPISIVLLAELAAHEAYPGHHTERTAKDVHLYRDLGRLETSVVIISAPEALVSEGIATNALEEALGPEPFGVIADILADLDLTFDPAEAHEIARAETALYGPAINAAFMLHEDGATTEEAEEYLREWALESNEKAARTVAFLTDASSRAYISTYTDGRRLCRDFADRGPGNFTRLLTEQLTTADLLP